MVIINMHAIINTACHAHHSTRHQSCSHRIPSFLYARTHSLSAAEEEKQRRKENASAAKTREVCNMCLG